MVAGPAAAQQANLTAPDSHICKGKRGRDWVQGDDLVITVGRRQIILAGDLPPTGLDQGALHPSLRHARANCNAAGISDPMRVHLADAGFASDATFTTAAEGILLIATTSYPLAADPATSADPAQNSINPHWRAMDRRLATPAGAALYRRRAAMVEPVFAQLFNPGGRRLHFRGPAKHTEITIMIACHNVGKYLKNPTPASRPPLRLTLLTTIRMSS